MELHFCEKCDRDFETRDPRRWCCVPCCGRAKKKIKRRCNWCGNRFTTTDDTEGYDSAECRANARISVAADRQVEMITPKEDARWTRNLNKRIPDAIKKRAMRFRFGRGMVETDD